MSGRLAMVFIQLLRTVIPPRDNAMPIAPPTIATSSHSTMCCTKMSSRRAPSARRTPISGARARNLASRSPIRLREQTARKSSDTTAMAVASSGTTFCSLSQPMRGVTRLLSGRGKRPAFFCSPT